MPDIDVTICGNIECECGERPVAFFQGTVRQVGAEWVVLVSTDQETLCYCGRKYEPGDPEVSMPVTYRAPIGKGLEVTARIKLLETNGGD